VLRERKAVASQRLRDLHDSPGDTWHSFEPSVRHALDAVERAAIDAQSQLATVSERKDVPS
jgi:hypothetical protein